MANEFDKILRSNFKEPKERLLKQLIPANIISLRPLVPKLQQTILERETDTVAEVETEEGKRFIIHIEWQSSNDTKMASRMALYDLLLAQTYGLDVMGAVLYLGNDPLRMTDTYSFFGFSYQCRMIDVRLLDPELFLQSDDAGELIFAILTGTGGMEQKVAIAKRILSKLQELYASDTTMFRVKMKQLELLSLLRGEDIQNIIIQEERKMPVTIDITKDQRYRQGLEEKSYEIAENLLKRGLDVSFVQSVTGLPAEKLEAIAKNLHKE